MLISVFLVDWLLLSIRWAEFRITYCLQVYERFIMLTNANRINTGTPLRAAIENLSAVKRPRSCRDHDIRGTTHAACGDSGAYCIHSNEKLRLNKVKTRDVTFSSYV
jgi:hypothetical protein